MKLLACSLASAITVLLFAACGGTDSSLLGGGGDGGFSLDGAGGDGSAHGDGGCIDPTEGQSCGKGDVACSSGDPCCVGYAWACIDGKWNKEGLGCACMAKPDAGPFACGDKTCEPGEFCEVQPPGIAFEDGGTPPTSYTCRTIPSECSASPSCACIEAKESCSVGSCSIDGSNVTVSCIGA